MSDESRDEGKTPQEDPAHLDEAPGGDPHPDEETDDGPKRRGKAPRRHTVGTVMLASALILGLVTGLSVVYIYRHLNGNITTIHDLDDVDNRPDKVDTGPGEPLNILVLGSDTREGEGNSIDKEAGGGVSDTTILLHLSGDRKRAYGISIPRDSMVPRPDCGPDDEIPGADKDMWNVAYRLGGPGCTIEQFEQATGVRVDDFIVVDFAGFKDMVDAIDGVPVCIPEDIDDPAHNIFIPAGERELKGNEALNYVRVRYTLGDGSDLGRVKRQQAFLAAMVNKVVSAGTLTRPDRVVSFLNAATRSLRASPGLDNVTQLGKLGYGLQSIGLDNVQFITVPWMYDPADRNRVIWKPEADLVWKRIRLDRKLSPRMKEGVINAQKPPGSSAPAPSAEPSPDGDETPDPTPTESAGPSGAPSPSPTQKPPAPSQEERDEAEKAGLCV